MIKKKTSVPMISSIKKYFRWICALFPVLLMAGKGGQCSVIIDNPVKQDAHLAFLAIMLFVVASFLALFLIILHPEERLK